MTPSRPNADANIDALINALLPHRGDGDPPALLVQPTQTQAAARREIDAAEAKRRRRASERRARLAR